MYFLSVGRFQPPFARQVAPFHFMTKSVNSSTSNCEVINFSEILGHVEFLYVKENVVFGSVEISSCHTGHQEELESR